MNAGWTRDALLAPGDKASSRHFWSCWMKRVLAPHQRAMTTAHHPIAVIDLDPGAGEAQTALLAMPPVAP
jgi:hypothetical protein